MFTTKYTPPGFHGLSGVVAGSVFSILAFGGFEGAAPLAEEARAAFVPAWCAGAGIKIAGISWISPLSYMGPAVAAWMVIGVGYLIYLYVVQPQRVIDVGLIHLEEVPADVAATDAA